MPTNEDLLNCLFSEMPENERAVLCSIPGDPNLTTRWPGTPWHLGGRCPLPQVRNNYVAISSFTANEDGEYRRRKTQFAAMYVVMLDDIGTKVDPKSIPRWLVPTLITETSPGNFQAVFKLTTPQRSIDEADALIAGIIKKITPTGVDPGMAGVSRVFRLLGVNGKPKYADENGEVWKVRVAVWEPQRTTTFEALAEAFERVLAHRTFAEPVDAVTVERKRGFGIVLAAARELGIVKKTNRGWVDVRCPWISEHTDRSDSGAALAFPAKANGYMGGYRCHHGHCQGRGWSDLEEWLSVRLHERARATRGAFVYRSQVNREAEACQA